MGKTTLNGINDATWINNVKIEGAQTISINNGKNLCKWKFKRRS